MWVMAQTSRLTRLLCELYKSVEVEQQEVVLQHVLDAEEARQCMQQQAQQVHQQQEQTLPVDVTDRSAGHQSQPQMRPQRGCHTMLKLPPQLQVVLGDVKPSVEALLASANALSRVGDAVVRAARRVKGNIAVASLDELSDAYYKLVPPVQRPSPAEASALTVARSASDCLQVLLSCPELQQLPQQLQEVGEQLCAALPTSLTCNSPACST